jgi:hypothetical protein
MGRIAVGSAICFDPHQSFCSVSYHIYTSMQPNFLHPEMSHGKHSFPSELAGRTAPYSLIPALLLIAKAPA